MLEAANHTLPANAGNPKQLLRRVIEPQRAKVLQAHAIMICLREVLLHADGADVVIYADAADAAAALTNDAAEGLDSVKLRAIQ